MRRISIALLILCCAPLWAQQPASDRLLEEIRQIPIFDDHGHPGFADDSEQRDEIAEFARRRGSEHLGQTVHGEETLVIGDTPLDIRCGRAIGARVLAVGTGGATMEELAAHKPDILVKDLTEADVAAALA